MSTTPDHYAHDPFRWLKTGKALDRAAMLIWAAIRADLERIQSEESRQINLEDYPNMDLGGVFWLNGGFALENLLKGIIIQDDPSKVISGIISKQLKSHNLHKLAELASVDINPIEGYFLFVGTECITWAGRYPSSIKAGE